VPYYAQQTKCNLECCTLKNGKSQGQQFLSCNYTYNSTETFHWTILVYNFSKSREKEVKSIMSWSWYVFKLNWLPNSIVIIKFYVCICMCDSQVHIKPKGTFFIFTQYMWNIFPQKKSNNFYKSEVLPTIELELENSNIYYQVVYICETNGIYF
jgi:hypothetical protein